MYSNKIYNEASGDTRIDIFGAIGEDFWSGDDGNTAIRWKDIIDECKKKKARCHVRINSLGGDVNDALAMYEMLRGLDDVTTEAIGFCASAGTIIFMASHQRHIAKTARFLIHRCSSYAWGNANEMQRAMEMQREIDDLIMSIYTEAGCDHDKVQELMDANDGNGRWLSADLVKEYGFATDITDGGEVKDSYRWSDIRNAHLPIPDDMRPSILDRIRYVFNQIQPDMPKDNTNLEAQVQELQNQVADLSAAKEQQAAQIEALTSERDNYQAKVAELQNLIDQVPTTDTSVNGNDNPPKGDTVADYVRNSEAYKAVSDLIY